MVPPQRGRHRIFVRRKNGFEALTLVAVPRPAALLGPALAAWLSAKDL